MSYSPRTFNRLLDMKTDSLEDMSLQSPSPDDIGWTRLPSFKKKGFPSLRSLKFAVITALQLFPASPGLTAFTIHLFADEPQELTDILKQSFPFKWNCSPRSLCGMYSNLKKFGIVISMQYNV
ncbi:hypothetical protein F5146DRAFT_1129581 [Armillaria mellea]|nr:hypothetical protein F5146DRAFT_1129581 [Armillaria mellea]